MIHRMGVSAKAVVILSVLVSGCTTWGPPRSRIPGSVATGGEERLIVWTASDSLDLHSVVVADSLLIGRRWGRNLGCGSCRDTVSLSEIDSVRLRTFSRSRTIVTVTIPALLTFFLIGYIGVVSQT